MLDHGQHDRQHRLRLGEQLPDLHGQPGGQRRHLRHGPGAHLRRRAGVNSVSATATRGTVTYSSTTPSVCGVDANSGALTIDAADCARSRPARRATTTTARRATRRTSRSRSPNAVTFGTAPAPTYGDAPGVNSVSATPPAAPSPTARPPRASAASTPRPAP